MQDWWITVWVVLNKAKVACHDTSFALADDELAAQRREQPTIRAQWQSFDNLATVLSFIHFLEKNIADDQAFLIGFASA